MYFVACTACLTVCCVTAFHINPRTTETTSAPPTAIPMTATMGRAFEAFGVSSFAIARIDVLLLLIVPPEVLLSAEVSMLLVGEADEKPVALLNAALVLLWTLVANVTLELKVLGMLLLALLKVELELR